MRKYFVAIAALLLLVAPAYAQHVQRVPLAIAWDMNGEAADDDQVVEGPDALTDSASFTVDAQPDTCRLLNITVVDADSSLSAGVLTVTGTDCYGDAQTCTFTFAAGGSGVKALTYGTGSGLTCAFSTVTTVTTGVLTGEGGADTVEVGYAALNSDYTYPIYGIRTVANGRRYIDPFRYGKGLDDITINGTAVASYHTRDGGAFQNLVAGDLIYINIDGQPYERKLTTVTDDDNAVIDLAIPTAVAPATTDQISFRYKKFYKLVEAYDAWIPVRGRDSFLSIADVDACSATGGCTTSVECVSAQNLGVSDIQPVSQVDTDNVADAATGTNNTSVDLNAAGFTYCRVGMKFGTGDTAGTDDFNLTAQIRRRN